MTTCDHPTSSGTGASGWWACAWAGCLALAWAFFTEADHRATQPRMENHFIRMLSRPWRDFVILQGRVPADLTELARDNPSGGFVSIEAHLRTYGAEAGFSRSLAEKYVFSPPGLALPRHGKTNPVLVINARPYHDRDGVAWRSALIQIGDGLEVVRVAEPKFKEAMRQAGLERLPVVQGAASPAAEGAGRGVAWHWHRLPALPLAVVFAASSLASGLRWWMARLGLHRWHAARALGWSGWLRFLLRVVFVVNAVVLLGAGRSLSRHPLWLIAHEGAAFYLVPAMLALALAAWPFEAHRVRILLAAFLLAAVLVLFMPAFTE